VGEVEKLLSNFDIAPCLKFNRKSNIFKAEDSLFQQVNDRLSATAKVRLRDIISHIASEELLDRRAEFMDFHTPEMIAEAEGFGIRLISTYLVDITFPKRIPDLFARQLEAKIRAKSDLENARTLKNAAELIKDNPHIGLLQVLETLTKVSTTGKHTFVIGNWEQFTGWQNGK
jgi:regulator of protease activity HflC (stomatin/prohibitin superfamily)